MKDLALNEKVLGVCLAHWLNSVFQKQIICILKMLNYVSYLKYLHNSLEGLVIFTKYKDSMGSINEVICKGRKIT